MTVVIGTAGHIDHGKTTLLRALTGIDADRLPEERRRGMTIDVGYAHLALDDGRELDFVDVPGHDRLVGNMLVGAGEIDAALLVVAADDGPRAQTLEHVALLDALGVAPGLAVVTKTDMVEPARVEAVVAAVHELLAPTSLAGSPVLVASASTGEGLDALRVALAAMASSLGSGPGSGFATRPPTLAIDRLFTVKGRGVVVTGTLRGASLARGDRLRLVPGDGAVRVREIQVHGRTVAQVEGGGRAALNLAGVEAERLHRGQVLTADPAVAATDRVLVAFEAPIADRARGRLHAGTAAVDAVIGRSGHDALVLPDGRPAGIVRLAAPIALRPGDRAVLRRGPGIAPVGATMLDVKPPRGISRRRQSVARVDALATGAPTAGTSEARLDLHGATIEPDGRVRLAPDVRLAAIEGALAAVGDETPLPAVRAAAAVAIRRQARVPRDAAASAATEIVNELVRDGRLERDGDGVRPPGQGPAAPDPALGAAMDRLELVLAVVAPPPLGDAARAAGCSAAGITALERSARIVVLEPDLAYAMTTYRDLAAQALRLSTVTPLTPAAFRDATGTSRKYVMAILEDLDRRAILRRTPAGHVPGPKAPAAVRAAAPR